MTGVGEGLVVDAVPGRAKRQVVADAGTFEDLPHGVGGDALHLIAASEVLMRWPHVEGWEVVGLQDDLIVLRQLGMRSASTGEQNTKQ